MEPIKNIAGRAASVSRPVALSIAGLDPSGGAGLLSDIKTFEQSGVYGLGISTGNTVQTDDAFFDVEWTKLDIIAQSLAALSNRFEIAAIKIGVLPGIMRLADILSLIRQYCPRAMTLWDPVFKSSTAFTFMDPGTWSVKQKNLLRNCLKSVSLVTPNVMEAAVLARSLGFATEALLLEERTGKTDPLGDHISDFCPVLIKGGHRRQGKGMDKLYITEEVSKQHWTLAGKALANDSAKHGSGCVLSAAITAGLANGLSLMDSCKKAKAYTTGFLLSTSTLIGLHAE